MTANYNAYNDEITFNINGNTCTTFHAKKNGIRYHEFMVNGNVYYTENNTVNDKMLIHKNYEGEGKLVPISGWNDTKANPISFLISIITPVNIESSI